LSADRPEGDKSPRTIVLVDDSPTVRSMVQLVLGSAGYRVLTLDGPVGFKPILQRERPALVLVDVTMPALEGPKLVEITRRNRLHECPILLYSARSDAELAGLASSCGASGYIKKGSGPLELLQAVRRYVLP
jgi:DNA-binding response OmpR family regulator